MAAFMVLYLAAELELKRIDAELLEVRLRRKSAAARLNHLKRMLRDDPTLVNDKENDDPNAKQYQVDAASDADMHRAATIWSPTDKITDALSMADALLAKNKPDPEIKRFLDQYGEQFKVALTKKPADREPEEEAIVAHALDLGLSER
jgi:hypothetical protein